VETAKLEHSFPFDFETLIKIREDRYDHVDFFKTFSSTRKLSEKEDNGIRTRTYRLIMRSGLPMFAQKLLQDGEGISVFETTIFDPKQRTYRAEAVLSLMNTAIGFKESSVYFPDGDQSRRTIEIVTNVKVPLIGSTVEKVIVREFHKESQLDFDRIMAWQKMK